MLEKIKERSVKYQVELQEKIKERSIKYQVEMQERIKQRSINSCGNARDDLAA